MSSIKFVINSKTELACEACGAVMIVKENRTTGHQFLGCNNWPDCDRTRSIPESMKMRASGQPELFSDVYD